MASTVVQEMATLLRAKEIDLGDERAVIRCLTDGRFEGGEVAVYMDRAVEEARKGGVSLAEVLGDGVAGALAISVWVAGYCVICPPGSF